MAGERYVVELEFKRIGDLGAEHLTGKLTKATSKLDEFKKGWSDLRGSVAPLGAAFDGVLRSAARVATIGVAAGGAAFMAGATYGVINLNNELEKATIGLGVIFNASGVASSVPAGLERAKQVVAQMRVDAQKLPGEFSELQNIFTTGATPAFRSGATIDQLRELSAKAMVAGKVTNMDMGQVAREFTLLLEGRAGSHNTFGSKMGLTGATAKQYNALEGEKRFAELSKLLSKYDSGLTMFEESFDAHSSTLIDSVKDFGRGATEPLFEAVKSTMAEANGYIKEHKQELNEYATSIGYAIRDGFVEAKGLVMEWGPRVLEFAEGAQVRFHAMWYDAQKIAESLGITADSLRSALEDPNGTIDKAIKLGEIYLALKGVSMVVGAGQGLYAAASGAGSIMSSLGLLGGGAAAGAAGAGAAAGAGGAAAGASALAVAAAGAAFIAMVGGVTAAGWQFSELLNDLNIEHSRDSHARAEAAMREIREFAKLDATTGELQERQAMLSAQLYRQGDETAAGLLDVAFAAAQAAGELRSIRDGGGRGAGPFGNDNWDKPMPYGFDPASINYLAKKIVEPNQSPDASAHKHKGGGGGTIQKVEIVVTSNQHPSRIARAVVGLLGQQMRNPGSSPHVTNYGALEQE